MFLFSGQTRIPRRTRRAHHLLRMAKDHLHLQVQFHQYFTRAFFADILAPKISKLKRSYEKRARKTLMKSTTGSFKYLHLQQRFLTFLARRTPII